AVRYRRLAPVAGQCAALLSALAWIGTDDQAQARRAFAAGCAAMDQTDVQLPPAEQCSRARLDEALDTLAQLAPPLKRKLINAAAAAILADKAVTVREAELLRAICDSLDAPMPPSAPAAHSQ